MPRSATTRKSASGSSDWIMASRLAGSARTASALASVTAWICSYPSATASIFGDVRLAHALQPVEAVGVPGSDADQDRRPCGALRKERGARERVRAASGPADDGELVDAKRIGDGGHVPRDVRDLPSGQPVRFSVARPVEADQPHAEPVKNG